jgi:hypothetical protein
VEEGFTAKTQRARRGRRKTRSEGEWSTLDSSWFRGGNRDHRMSESNG